jgi:hypothetical protein
MAAFAAWAVRGIVSNPGFAFLLPRDGARWIRMPSETALMASFRAPISGVFGKQFRLDAPLTDSTLYVMAFRSVRVYLDGKALLEETDRIDAWKFERRVGVPGALPAGDHALFVVCTNDTGPPMVRVRWPDAGLQSGPGWFSVDGRSVRAPASWAAGFPPPALALAFPTVRESLLSLLPLLIIASTLGGITSWIVGRRERVAVLADRLLSPSNLRWALLGLLLALGVNNMMKLGRDVGADIEYHYEYIHHVADKHRFPAITESPQAFQAPLFYAIAAVVHQVFRVFMDEAGADRFLRLIPIFCGLGLVDVAYRLSRRMFVDNVPAQRVAIVISATFPMLVVKTPVATNEPLSGLLAAAAALAVLDLLIAPIDSRRPGRWAFAGLLWGLALLTKVSAIVLAAPFLLGLAWWMYAWPGGLRRKVMHVSLFLAVFGVTCGWFFVRTQVLYGKPVVGGWDPLIGFEWWQFPGYRSIEQYTSFGAALVRPIYSLVQGFWDGLYAGLWFDAEFSGMTSRANGPTWNFRFALAALAWAVAPTIALGIGAVRALSPRRVHSDDARPATVAVARLFALLVAGTYAASILGHSLTLPYYNVIKATYALGAVPSIAVLIVTGVEPLLRRRWGRAVIHAWLAAWILLVGAGYWALAPA